MRIDRIEILPVIYGAGHELAAEVLRRPGVDDPWSCHPGALGADGILHLDLGGFLIRTWVGRCWSTLAPGPSTTGKYVGGRFLDSLRGHGRHPTT